MKPTKKVRYLGIIPLLLWTISCSDSSHTPIVADLTDIGSLNFVDSALSVDSTLNYDSISQQDINADTDIAYDTVPVMDINSLNDSNIDLNGALSCLNYSPCDSNNQCPQDFWCIDSRSFCEREALCIPFIEACELKCGEGSDCWTTDAIPPTLINCQN